MIDWSKLKYAKPGPKARSTTAKRRHARERTAKRKAQTAVIAAVREKIWCLDISCAVCGKGWRNDADGEMHEIIPRSKTRGLPPDERFTVQNCIRLHRDCHEAVTGTVGRDRAFLSFVDNARGIDGGVIVGYRYGKDREDIWWTYRRILMGETKTKPTTAAVKKPMRPGQKKPAST